MNKLDFSKLTGEVITKEDFRYEEYRKCFNRAIEKYPLAIVYCASVIDIRNSILWARENNIDIRIRSGGHNYEGYSTGNNVLIIDVSKMNKINVDEENGIVRIEGGVRNREMYEALGSLVFPFPGGGCPTVGIAGLVLGGGWGYSSRLLGLASDSLIQLDIVNHKGNIVKASSTENTDLFWACKGAGGGNFGVVTSMTFKLPKTIEMATLINIEYPNMIKEEKIDLFDLWQKSIMSIDRRLNMKLAFYNSTERGKGAKIVGLFYGNKIEGRNVIEPFIDVASKVNVSLEYLSVIDANRMIQNSHPDYESYKSTGRFIYDEYRRNQIEGILNLIENKEEGSVYTAISLYGLGGAVLDTDNGTSAFPYRDAKSILGFQSVWEESKYAEVNNKWVRERFETIKSLTRGSFINFPLSELEDYEEEYYGDNIKKLKLIKKKYDPQNIFDFSQGIK